MKLIKIKPYFIEYVDNNENFSKLQLELFAQGYRWLNGTKVWIVDNQFIEFPLYVSNLDFDDVNTEHIIKIRTEHESFGNDVMFVSENKEDFNLNLLRKEKLERLSEYE